MILKLGLYERDEEGKPVYDEKRLKYRLAGPERNRIKSRRRDSNPRPFAYKANALTS